MNVFRPRARAGLYICPAEGASAQLFFDLKSMRLQVVQSVSFASTPALVLGLLADSGLYAPFGTYTAPAPDAHSAALKALLTVSCDLTDVYLSTDPLSGMPVGVSKMVLLEGADGALVMVPRGSGHAGLRSTDSLPGVVGRWGRAGRCCVGPSAARGSGVPGCRDVLSGGSRHGRLDDGGGRRGYPYHRGCDGYPFRGQRGSIRGVQWSYLHWRIPTSTSRAHPHSRGQEAVPAGRPRLGSRPGRYMRAGLARAICAHRWNLPGYMHHRGQA